MEPAKILQTYQSISGWWFQPLWKIWVRQDHESPNWIEKNISHVPNHQPAINPFIYIYIDPPDFLNHWWSRWAMDFLHAPLIERSFYPKILGLQDLSIVKTSQNWLKTSEIPKSGWINSISIPENRSNILIFRQHLLGKIQPHPCRPGDVVAVPGTGDGLSARVLQPARMGVVNQLISGLGTILVVGYIYIYI